MATTVGTPGTRRVPGGTGDGDGAGAGSGGALRAALHRLDVRGTPYLFVAPFFVLFAAIGLFPLLYTGYVSLQRWDLLDSSGHSYIGLGNYRELLSDSDFWNALWNTLSICVLSTAPQLVLALGVAALLNSAVRARTFFRLGVVLPIVTSLAAVGIIFGQLYARDFGLVNYVLHGLGLPGVDWRGSRLASHVAVSTMITWRWTGYNALIYLAGMQAIPNDLYEAAEIDGAGALRRFRDVTLPMLRPTILFTVIVSVIGGLQVFAEPLLFDATPGNVTGGPDRQFQTLTLLMYEHGFRNLRFGYASAIAWMLFLLIVVVSVAVTLVTRRRVRAANES